MNLEEAEQIIMHDKLVLEYSLMEERCRHQHDIDKVSGNAGAWHQNLETRTVYRCWIIPRDPTKSGVCDAPDLAQACALAYENAKVRVPPQIMALAQKFRETPQPAKTSPFPNRVEKEKKKRE